MYVHILVNRFFLLYLKIFIPPSPTISSSRPYAAPPPNMTDGKRKRAVRHSPDLKLRKSLKKRTKGFVRIDQRLPESPPLSNSPHTPSGIMASVRARYRHALDLLFGTIPRVLNSACFNPIPHTPHQPVAKRKRHLPPPTTSPSDSDQVVPHQTHPLPPATPIRQPTQCSSSHQCSCSNALWNVNGIGPELMLRTAEELSERIIVLYGKAIDPQTGDINYSSLIHSTDFHQYLISAQKLRYFDPLLLNDTDRKAFFLNVYNSLMIHAIAVMSKPRTMFERISLYNTASYNIGGRSYSLNVIEHGVLRSNRRGAGPFAQPPFTESDARRQCILPRVDPRIHFALNCGARSCPNVRFYEAHNINSALDAATRAYLVDVQVDYQNRTITLPKLLKWYQVDFCDDHHVESAIKWTLPYLEDTKRRLVDLLLTEKEQNNQTFKVVYACYDWTVNDSSV